MLRLSKTVLAGVAAAALMTSGAALAQLSGKLDAQEQKLAQAENSCGEVNLAEYAQLLQEATKNKKRADKAAKAGAPINPQVDADLARAMQLFARAQAAQARHCILRAQQAQQPRPPTSQAPAAHGPNETSDHLSMILEANESGAAQGGEWIGPDRPKPRDDAPPQQRREAKDQPQSNQSSMNLSPWARDVFTAHNAAREAVGSPALKWRDDLAQHAQARADELARVQQLVHAPREGRGTERENILQAPRGYTAAQEMGRWTREAGDFVPGKFPDVSRTGNWMDVAHYTQMVSIQTSFVGCGHAVGGGFDWVVCRYDPGGNKDGKPILGDPGQLKVAARESVAHTPPPESILDDVGQDGFTSAVNVSDDGRISGFTLVEGGVGVDDELPLSWGADVDVVNKYVWRGFMLDDRPRLDNVFVSGYSFAASAWFELARAQLPDPLDSIDPDAADYFIFNPGSAYQYPVEGAGPGEWPDITAGLSIDHPNGPRTVRNDSVFDTPAPFTTWLSLRSVEGDGNVDSITFYDPAFALDQASFDFVGDESYPMVGSWRRGVRVGTNLFDDFGGANALFEDIGVVDFLLPNRFGYDGTLLYPQSSTQPAGPEPEVETKVERPELGATSGTFDHARDASEADQDLQRPVCDTGEGCTFQSTQAGNGQATAEKEEPFGSSDEAFWRWDEDEKLLKQAAHDLLVAKANKDQAAMFSALDKGQAALAKSKNLLDRLHKPGHGGQMIGDDTIDGWDRTVRAYEAYFEAAEPNADTKVEQPAIRPKEAFKPPEPTEPIDPL